MTRSLVALAALWIAALCARSASADTIYVSDRFKVLHAYDSVAGTSAVIGTTGVGQMYDIAIDPSGNLYGVTASDIVYGIGATDAAVTLSGRTGRSLNALAFDAAGTLYGSSEFGGLYIIDPATGASTLINAIKNGSVQYFSQGDLAFDAAGVLYMSTTTNQLVRIDPGTGAATLIGTHGIALLHALAFDSAGTLFGFTRTGLVYTLDTSNAARTFIGISGIDAYGAATNPFGTPGAGGNEPVPEPSTWVLVGLALTGAAGVRRRRGAA